MADLINRDALISELFRIEPAESNLVAQVTKLAMLKAAFDAPSAVPPKPTAGGWISVEDRLPNDGLVGKLIYDPENGIRVCTSCTTIGLKGGKTIYSADAHLIEILTSGTPLSEIDDITHITHWMPLPEPPQEVSGDD